MKRAGIITHQQIQIVQERCKTFDTGHGRELNRRALHPVDDFRKQNLILRPSKQENLSFSASEDKVGKISKILRRPALGWMDSTGMNPDNRAAAFHADPLQHSGCISLFRLRDHQIKTGPVPGKSEGRQSTQNQIHHMPPFLGKRERGVKEDTPSILSITDSAWRG